MIILDTEQKEINHLTYIKSNPNCNTNADCLDNFVIETLHKKGYLKGPCITSPDSETPKYVELQITSSGKKYLNKFKGRNFFVKHWKWAAEHLLIPLIIGLIIAFILVFYLQPLQHNNQENKSEQKEGLQSQTPNK